MKIKNGKIVKCTESELYNYWLKSEMCEIMPFDYYKYIMRDLGIKIKGEKKHEKRKRI